MNKVSLLTAALTSALFGCSGAADMAMEGPPPSYHQEAATILSTYCTSCHQQGGIGPLSLTDYASARAAGPIIRGAVASGEMPPWLPSQNGVDLRYSRALRPADRDVLLKWIDSGMARLGQLLDQPVELPEEGPSTVRQAMCTPKNQGGDNALKGTLFELVRIQGGAEIVSQLPGFIKDEPLASRKLTTEVAKKVADRLYDMLNLKGLCG